MNTCFSNSVAFSRGSSPLPFPSSLAAASDRAAASLSALAPSTRGATSLPSRSSAKAGVCGTLSLSLKSALVASLELAWNFRNVMCS